MIQTVITGTVYATDTIRNVDAYARATFTDLTKVRYWEGQAPKSIDFRVLGVFQEDSVTQLISGLIQDTPTNVVFDLSVRQS
tara:strand:- start:712 stop:957 length:246 start_codon:yes stop_codon:yes gene_type:complete